jgi:hypothetical protein
MSDVLVPTGWSADANWFWDGWHWQDAVSPDGKWRLDGKDWKQFKGKRTPMPTEPLHPPPPPLPVQEAAVEMPASLHRSLTALPDWRARVHLDLGVAIHYQANPDGAIRGGS